MSRSAKGGSIQADAAVFHVEDAVGDVEDAVVVGDHQDGAAAAAGEFLEEVDDIATGLAIEGGGRFVGEDEFRIGDECSGDGDALFLAAGNFRGEIVEPFAEADAGENFRGSAPYLVGGDFRMKLKHHFDIFPHREEREEIVLLEDEADVTADEDEIVGGGEMERMREDREFPIADVAQSPDEGEECGFSAAAGTGEEDDFAGSDVEGDIEEDLLLEFALAEGEVQIARGDGELSVEECR